MTREGFDAVCRALPAVTMVVQWGDSQVYKVGGKVFCWLGPESTVTFKCTEIAYEMLTAAGVGFRAPYTTGGTWVGVGSLDALPDEDLAAYLRQAHGLIAAKLTRKARAELGL